MDISDANARARFWSKVKATESCWLWTGATRRGGYGAFYYRDRHAPAHRVAWELRYGQIPDGMVVCHKCDVPACVRPTHLFIGTQAENIADMFSKGREHERKGKWSTRGATHPRSKLTEDDVREIRRLYAAGEASTVSLGKRFGVSQATASTIVLRKSWAWLDAEPKIGTE